LPSIICITLSLLVIDLPHTIGVLRQKGRCQNELLQIGTYLNLPDKLLQRKEWPCWT